MTLAHVNVKGYTCDPDRSVPRRELSSLHPGLFLSRLEPAVEERDLCRNGRGAASAQKAQEWGWKRLGNVLGFPGPGRQTVAGIRGRRGEGPMLAHTLILLLAVHPRVTMDDK